MLLRAVIEAIVERFDTPVSIDTVKSRVARAAVEAGASIVNDVSGLRQDPGMTGVISSSGVAVVIVHAQGTPGTMQRDPRYRDLIGEIRTFLKEAAREAVEAGLGPNRIVLDPGLGFGKSYEHNFEIIRRLDEFTTLGYPLLIGPSRKTFVGLDFSLPPDEREEGSLAAAALCAAAGAHIIRVHDVAAARRAIFVGDGVKGVRIKAQPLV